MKCWIGYSESLSVTNLENSESLTSVRRLAVVVATADRHFHAKVLRLFVADVSRKHGGRHQRRHIDDGLPWQRRQQQTPAIGCNGGGYGGGGCRCGGSRRRGSRRQVEGTGSRTTRRQRISGRRDLLLEAIDEQFVLFGVLAATEVRDERTREEATSRTRTRMRTATNLG